MTLKNTEAKQLVDMILEVQKRGNSFFSPVPINKQTSTIINAIIERYYNCELIFDEEEDRSIKRALQSIMDVAIQQWKQKELPGLESALYESLNQLSLINVPQNAFDNKDRQIKASTKFASILLATIFLTSAVVGLTLPLLALTLAAVILLAGLAFAFINDQLANPDFEKEYICNNDPDFRRELLVKLACSFDEINPEIRDDAVLDTDITVETGAHTLYLR